MHIMLESSLCLEGGGDLQLRQHEIWPHYLQQCWNFLAPFCSPDTRLKDYAHTHMRMS